MRILETANLHFAGSFRRRAAARICVTVAMLLAALPPRWIKTILAMVRLGGRPATLREAHAARQIIVAISRVCAGESCLPRSIATALFCRLTGTWPTWCVGARSDPFEAHAWVEAEGNAVG